MTRGAGGGKVVGMRSMSRTTAAVAALALGIGATTAIFLLVVDRRASPGHGPYGTA